MEKCLDGVVADELGGNCPDLILGMVFPIESILASIEWKKRSRGQSKLIPVIFDNFVENPSLHRLAINRKLKRRRHLKLMIDTFDECDCILVMHNQKKYYYDNGLLRPNKTIFVEHPLLVPPSPIVLDHEEYSDSINLLYSGSFLRNYVVSEHLCELVKSLVDADSSIKAEFCVMGNGIKSVFTRDAISGSTDVEFEGKFYKTMRGFDEYLTKTYGNYMLLPPIEKRVSHHVFTAYWK